MDRVRPKAVSPVDGERRGLHGLRRQQSTEEAWEASELVDGHVGVTVDPLEFKGMQQPIERP